MSRLRVGSGECSRGDIFQGSAPSWLDNIIRRVIHVVSTVSLECDPGLFWPRLGSFDGENRPRDKRSPRCGRYELLDPALPSACPEDARRVNDRS